MRTRPVSVVFDVLGTLVSLEPLRGALEEAALPGASLETWFSRILRDGFALDAAGTFRPFADVARAALEGLLVQSRREPDPQTFQRVMAAMGELPLQDGAETAIDRLAREGIRLVALSNGSESSTRALLERNDILDRFEAVLSIDEVRHWKPRPEPYHLAIARLGVAPGEVALVAAHAWDVHGARAVGLTGAWVAELERVFPTTFGQPDISGVTVTDVIDRLLELPLARAA